jgi:hypothetical protein
MPGLAAWPQPEGILGNAGKREEGKRLLPQTPERPVCSALRQWRRRKKWVAMLDD